MLREIAVRILRKKMAEREVGQSGFSRSTVNEWAGNS
jgi:hypothetical protein